MPKIIFIKKQYVSCLLKLLTGINAKIRLTAIGLFICSSILCTALQGQVIGSGTETRVNTNTPNTQLHPAVAMDENGNYVVVWENQGADGSGFGIFGQRYDINGVPLGSEFPVNISTDEDQRYPAIAMDSDGDFVVVWMDEALDASGWGIYGRRFDKNGTPLGFEFLINSRGTLGHQKNPVVAMDKVGNFTVVWTHHALDGSIFSIRGRRYNNSGAALSTIFDVSTASTNYQGYPTIGIDDDGDFVVAWQQLGLDGSGHAIAAQRFDPVGTKKGSVFQVNTFTSGNQQTPAVDLDSVGNFVIAWSSYGQDGDDQGIYAQRFLNNGSAIGAEFRANTQTTGSQSSPALAMTREGSFNIIWSSYGQDGSFEGVYVQAYFTDGIAVGSETLVNTWTSGFQQFGAAAQTLANNDLVVIWQDGQHNSSSTHDGDNYGIFSQRFNVSLPFPVEWLDFRALAMPDLRVKLDWMTATETNNIGFSVFRSYDDTNLIWEKIGFVEGKGFSSTVSAYEFTDRRPGKGLIYYQLQQLDFDGGFSYSEIRSVYVGSGFQISVYPNPANDFLHVQMDGEASEVSYLLFDYAGKLIDEGSLDLSRGPAKLDLEGLSEGLYALQVLYQEYASRHVFVKE